MVSGGAHDLSYIHNYVDCFTTEKMGSIVMNLLFSRTDGYIDLWWVLANNLHA